MRVVTSGSAYIDIDAFAGCVAYAEFLNLRGIRAVAASGAAWNESITPSVRSLDAPLVIDYIPAADDKFVLIDVSDPDHFDRMVALERVEEVIDHHPGFEQYWQARLGKRAKIEFIGAACTLVYEHWKEAGLAGKMSETSARLLVSGILDNTLNFKARVTTERDRTAYNELLKLGNLDSDWTEQYFSEAQATILAGVASSLTKDTKTLKLVSFPDKPVIVGQLVVWEAGEVLDKYLGTISQVMERKSPQWFINLVGVSEGRSYLIARDTGVKEWVAKVLNATFDGPVAKANRLWLRKEIIKQDIEFAA